VVLMLVCPWHFHHCPGSTVSVDVPWSPYDVDGRNYDWLGLAEAADLLFVMAYDIQSQVSTMLQHVVVCRQRRL
jgi:spore germination protein YaaH